MVDVIIVVALVVGAKVVVVSVDGSVSTCVGFVDVCVVSACADVDVVEVSSMLISVVVSGSLAVV